MSLGVTLALAATLAAPTRYSVVERDGRWWFQAPNGERFLSMGVCVVDRGLTQEQWSDANPGYASYRFYASDEAWAKDTVARLQGWGFNTIGAWSDFSVLRQVEAPGLHLMPVLHMGSTAGAPWRDMWSEPVTADMRKFARGGRFGMDHVRGDPRVVGYFSDNEMGWWIGALFEWGFRAGGGTRARLVQTLRNHYGGDWQGFSRDFVTDGPSDWSEFAKGGRAYLRPGGSGMAAVRRWLGVVADRYYTLCRQIIKEEDPGALYLGDRYISNFYPEVARAAAHHVDVVSTNLNADWNDGRFAPFYLDALRRLTNKPVIITEYYVAAMENRSGNKNDSSGFPVVATQLDRAASFERQTRHLLGRPDVLGAHWFQYYDEPMHGRADGENYNMGLVDIYNVPYDELLDVTRRLDVASTASQPPEPWVGVAGGVPRAPVRYNRLESWPLERALVPSAKPADRGELYVTWAPQSLLVAVYWNEDRFFEALYQEGRVPEQDRAWIDLEVGGVRVRGRIGPDGPPRVQGAEVVAHRTGVRNEVILRIQGPRREGDELRIRGKLATRARAYELTWDTKTRLMGEKE